MRSARASVVSHAAPVSPGERTRGLSRRRAAPGTRLIYPRVRVHPEEYSLALRAKWRLESDNNISAPRQGEFDTSSRPIIVAGPSPQLSCVICFSPRRFPPAFPPLFLRFQNASECILRQPAPLFFFISACENELFRIRSYSQRARSGTCRK